MKIIALKLTGIDLMRQACSFTINKESKMSLDKIYRCEHSPIRTQIFWVEMKEIPSFVSVHLVRHKHGVEHFVQSLRDDRGGRGNETRESPVNHAMLINAQALINMARKRLCKQAHEKTTSVMLEIIRAVGEVDDNLTSYMVPDCAYRSGCYELKPCGYYERLQRKSGQLAEVGVE